MKMNKSKNINREHKKNSHGIITVMVCLFMVPVVVITGTLVDAARMKMYSSQAIMAADAYAQAILSEYDNVLKDVYGLFSVTQTEELNAIAEQMAAYGKESFNPNSSGDSQFSGFMPYAQVDVDFECEVVSDSSLSNQNVLMTQISDYMKYPIVQVLLENMDILDNLGEFDDVSAEMDAMEARENLTDECEKTIKAIQEYYDVLKKINDYPSYLNHERKDAYEAYVSKVKEIASGDDYKDFYYYKQHEDDIKEALKKQAENEEAEENEEELPHDLSEEEQKYIKWYNEHDGVENYGDSIAAKVQSQKSAAESHGTTTSKMISFDTANGLISELKTKAEAVQSKIDILSNQFNDYQQKINECPEDMQQTMRQEIEQLQNIVDHKDKFMAVYKAIEETNHDSTKNTENAELQDQQTQELQDKLDDMKDGKLDPSTVTWKNSISFQWYSFRENYSDFWDDLDKLCGDSGSGDSSKADAKKQAAKDAKANAEKQLEDAAKEEEAMQLRDIGDLAGELELASSPTKKIAGLSEHMSGGFSFDALKSLGVDVMDRLLVTVYDYEMFSSRVTGMPKPDDDSDQETDASGNYIEYTLTGVEKSQDVNYLYKAELEYLLAGKTTSKDNLAQVRNTICTIQTTANLVATFRIGVINDAINNISSQLSAMTGPLAPLTFVVLSGLLRVAVAALITVVDWNTLAKRGKVVVFKKSLSDISEALIQQIKDLVGLDIPSDGKEGGKLKASYENYLVLLLCLGVDNQTLLDRTSDLITLNVNQAKMPMGETTTSLKFKMTGTVTAVKATCKVKSDFVVVPENMAQMFIGGTDAEATIQSLEENYFGYSIIRGY